MRVFVTGATGFIGGSVAAHLAQAGHSVRGLLRDPARAGECRSFGIEPVPGDLDDHAVLTREARLADAVINAASSDHRAAVDTLIAALAGSGKALVHTSGTSVVADEARGEPSDAIFSDETPIRPAPDKAARVALDQAVLAAPGVRAVVLCNSLIYGDALGAAAHSVQLPSLIALARETGVARHIGRGLNRWSTVHIGDVAALYLLALEQAPTGFFAFVESGESSFGGMAEAIGRALGLGPAQPMDPAAAEARWGRERAVFALGSNSRTRSARTRALGWQPRRGPAEAWIEEHLAG